MKLPPQILDAKKLVRIALNIETGNNRLLKLIGKDHTMEQAIHIYHTLRKNS